MYITTNQSEREKWLEQTLQKIPTGSRILDAGAGELNYKKFCKHLKYVSQDFAQYDGKGNGRGLQTSKWDQTRLDIVSDITSIPEPDGSFDAVMCIEVLEHLPYPVDAMKELARLVRPGGYLVLTAPFNSLTHFAPYFFHPGYSRYFYEHWLPRLDFGIIDLTLNGGYFDYLAQEVNRVPSVAEQYSGRRIGWFERKALNMVSDLLGGLSRQDKGSSELLCFGIHIFAQKK